MIDDTKLKPCPFCGKQPKWWSCDRLITIECEECRYTRAFNGLVNNIPNDVPVRYEGGIISTTEFYHSDAGEKAVDAWNRRWTADDD